MKKFIKFGSLKNIDPEFKMRLYESFLQESKTTTSFGQFFTPRKVVSAIHDMAQVDRLAHGKEICDPASGVGGFVLEQMARDLSSQWALQGDDMIPAHHWYAFDTIPKTTILAKANALVHCGDFLADQPQRIPSFAKWLNKVFECYESTSIGSLETMYENKFDLILTNPPFVVSGSKDISKLIKANNKRKTFFGIKYSGVEGLFIQYVVKSLKINGDAWVLLPETFFLRTTDKTLRTWLFEQCEIDLLAILPERTFFNTPKRVIVAHLKKRPVALTSVTAQVKLKNEKTLLFTVSEIGETRDAKRFPYESNLPELTQTYKAHIVGMPIPQETKRAVVTVSINLYGKSTLNLRHFWDKEVARELGLLGSDEDPSEARQELDKRVQNLEVIVKEWRQSALAHNTPRTPASWKTVSLGDTNLFNLSIGRRVLKKEIYENKTGVALFSANIRAPFGYVHVANAGNLHYGGALWSIDSDFDCRSVAPGELYSITDHCGQVTLLVNNIDPHYLARQIKQAGLNQGFNRDYRPSLQVIKELEIDLPISDDDSFNLGLMQEWTVFQEEIDRTSDGITKVLKGIE